MDNTGDILRDMIVKDPFDDGAKGIYADWLEERAAGDNDRNNVRYLRKGLIPLGALDIRVIVALNGCRIGMYERRFIEGFLGHVTRLYSPMLTPRQYLWMWILARRYRNQIEDAEIVREAQARYDDYCSMIGVGEKPLVDRVPTKNTEMELEIYDFLTENPSNERPY